MLTVHLRINDSSTGQPTPVRIRISVTAAEQFAPLGRLTEFPTGRNEAVGGNIQIEGERWYYIDGHCEVMLPAGRPLRVQVSKGPEYRPIDERVTLGAGQISLRLTLSRADHALRPDWYSADFRSHFLAPHTGLLEAMAEDLNIVYALATPTPFHASDGTTYRTIPDLIAFSGQNPSLTATPNHLFFVNTLNTHPRLGTVSLLHSHRIVFPLTFGGPNETDDWSLCDWCDQCHRKNGLSVWVNALSSTGELTGGEALIAAILGKIDALELSPPLLTHDALQSLYRLWEAGVLLPLVGASGKASNRVPLGLIRTYAHVPGEFSLAAWVETIRSGHTFVTSGPFLDFQVDGNGPGATVDASGEVRITTKAWSLEPFDRLELIANGMVIHSTRPEFSQEQSAWFAHAEVPVTFVETTWLAARCGGENGLAHTSPVIIRMNSQLLRKRGEAVEAMVALIQETIEWAQSRGRYENVKRKEQLLLRCHEAIEKLRRTS